MPCIADDGAENSTLSDLQKHPRLQDIIERGFGKRAYLVPARSRFSSVTFVGISMDQFHVYADLRDLYVFDELTQSFSSTASDPVNPKTAVA